MVVYLLSFMILILFIRNNDGLYDWYRHSNNFRWVLVGWITNFLLWDIWKSHRKFNIQLHSALQKRNVKPVLRFRRPVSFTFGVRRSGNGTAVKASMCSWSTIIFNSIKPKLFVFCTMRRRLWSLFTYCYNDLCRKKSLWMLSVSAHQ